MKKFDGRLLLLAGGVLIGSGFLVLAAEQWWFYHDLAAARFPREIENTLAWFGIGASILFGAGALTLGLGSSIPRLSETRIAISNGSRISRSPRGTVALGLLACAVSIAVAEFSSAALFGWTIQHPGSDLSPWPVVIEVVIAVSIMAWALCAFLLRGTAGIASPSSAP